MTGRLTPILRRRLARGVAMLAALHLLLPPASAQTMPSQTPSIAGAAARTAGLSARVLWIDGTANLTAMDSREKVAAALDRAKRANLNCVVVDVKPLVGEVLYNSAVAPRLESWLGTPYPAGYDLLQTALEEGHKRGLPVYASLNVFSEGHKSVSRGVAYRRPEWQVVAYEPVYTVAAPDGATYPLAARNAEPAADEMGLFLAAAVPERLPLAGEIAATYDGDRVLALVAGGQTDGAPLPVPPRPGGMLVGRGAAAGWMLEHLAVGGPISFRMTPRTVPAAESRSDRYALFVNPLNPEVRRYELSLITEVATRYEVDGVVFDRMRYPGLHGDFSEESRRAFERRIGRAVADWPAAVLRWPARPGDEVIRGPLFREWLEFRSRTIHDFAVEAAEAVRRARPSARVGVYVGSWYEGYFDVGVNWGSPGFAPGYDWMSGGYPATGYADVLDFLCSGTYHPMAWKAQAPQSPGRTVEGSSELTLRAVADQTWAYGSLYLLQYAGKPAAFQEAVRAALAATQGVMIFDMSYLDQYGWWPVLADALRDASGSPPHQFPSLLRQVRATRAEADRLRGRTPPPAPGSIPVSTEHPDL